MKPVYDLDAILANATKAIDLSYFRLPVANNDSVYRERVYCYELYHQMRCLWPVAPLLLTGEVDKAGHPVWKTKSPKPDFLIHEPGSKNNHAVIEVKPSRRSSNFQKDLECLSSFRNRAGYHRAIYLVYGNEAIDVIPAIQQAARRIQNLAPIELWLHSKAGEPAECKQNRLLAA